MQDLNKILKDKDREICAFTKIYLKNRFRLAQIKTMSQENPELDIDTQLKQSYLRKEIIEKGHSAEKFSEFLASIKPGYHSPPRHLFDNG